MFLPSVCLVPAGLICNSYFNLCSLFKKVNNLHTYRFKVAKRAVSSRTHCSNSWILNDIVRNCLLGKRNKIAKYLMRTFTCRSSFPYGWRLLKLWRPLCRPRDRQIAIFDQKIIFLNFWSSKSWVQILISIQPKMLLPDPESMNLDPKH